MVLPAPHITRTSWVTSKVSIVENGGHPFSRILCISGFEIFVLSTAKAVMKVCILEETKLDGIYLPSTDPPLGLAKGCITHHNASRMIHAFVIFIYIYISTKCT
jgi:hypothetical protein